MDNHYHVDQKPAEKGKAYVFQLTTAMRNILFAVEKEQIFDLLMFFLRTQIRLREDLEGKTKYFVLVSMSLIWMHNENECIVWLELQIKSRNLMGFVDIEI